MTNQEKWERVINGLRCCAIDSGCAACPYDSFKDCPGSYPTPETLMKDALALLKALSAFKAYFDDLYGKGLEVANWHMNGATEPFDNFYDSAMEEYENAGCN